MGEQLVFWEPEGVPIFEAKTILLNRLIFIREIANNCLEFYRQRQELGNRVELVQARRNTLPKQIAKLIRDLENDLTQHLNGQEPRHTDNAASIEQLRQILNRLTLLLNNLSSENSILRFEELKSEIERVLNSEIQPLFFALQAANDKDWIRQQKQLVEDLETRIAHLNVEYSRILAHFLACQHVWTQSEKQYRKIIQALAKRRTS